MGNNGWVEKDEDIWECTLVGKESESACVADGQDCSASQCCSNAGSHCFKKNDEWASCNATCNQHYMWENNGWADQGEEKVWDCEILSEGGVDKGDSDCAVDGQDCSKSKCCVSEGKTCFQKNEYWATCNETCSYNYLWENNGWVDKGDEKIWDCKVLSAEQESECAQDGPKSKCCASAGKQCFRKSEWWATCHETCSPN